MDTLLHEYGWTLEYLLWQVRLAVAFALYAAIAARYGNKPAGPTYLDREILEALQDAQKGTTR